MDETEWRKQANEEGYDEFIKIDWTPGLFNDNHTHEFAANLFILSGDMTVTTDSDEINCSMGDSGALDAGVKHSELVGPNGVSFLLARRIGK